MIQIIQKKDCTGCGACATVCPKKSIAMRPDEEGFIYPHIDPLTCVDCGLCQRACPACESADLNPDPVAYAAQYIDSSVRRCSSSGGVFSAIAAHVLEMGGAVFGAAFDADFELSHICVEHKESLEKLRGSKYVQSRIGEAYAAARSMLEAGRMVCFTGTPCQIGGLMSYLGKEYDHLITSDLICHGVPSPEIWKQYVAYRTQIAGAKLRNIRFRDKTTGWRRYSFTAEFENGKVYTSSIQNDAYMRAFLANLCLRPSCYDCRFKTRSRVSDLTLGDFWGVWDVASDLYDDAGTSLILVHSSRGAALLDAIGDKLVRRPVDLEQVIPYNASLIRSADLPKDRDAFFAETARSDLSNAVKKYFKGPSLLQKIKAVVRRTMQRF